MIWPSRRAAVLLAVLSLTGLLALVTDVGLDVMLAADALLVVLVAVDALLAARGPELSVERLGPEAFTQGRGVELRYRWTNSGRRPAHLQVREVRPQLLGGVQPARAVAVPARGTATEQLDVLPARRGRESAGQLVVRSSGPLGLSERTVKIPLPWSVIVYPGLPAASLKASIALAARRREAGLKPVRAPGEGRQFERLREWVPGDDTRFIDWKASARRRTVITRQFEDDRRQQLLIVVDTGRSFTAEVGGEARLEYVVRAAQRLAMAGVHQDDNVGIMTFASQVDAYVAPMRGRRGLRAVLDVLARVEATMVEPDYPAAFRHLAVKNRKRALVVVFTDVIDRLASQALLAHAALLRPRHLPLVVTLRNPDIDRAAAQRPGVSADAHRKAAAEALLGAREAALTQMRRTGLVVLDVPPDRADAMVVRRYLDLKARGRI